jgi:transcriptional regulator with XRE-family HTH domain
MQYFCINLISMKTTYGERLRLAREQKGLTQEQLVEKSGVKQGTISKIERGDQNSSGFDAELAYALGVEAMWLKTGKDEFAPAWISGKVTDVKQVTKEALDFAKLFDELPAEQKAALNMTVLAFVNLIKNQNNKVV